ncbi:MAG TPA: branched-chain amino acid ABC transporter substrate-binding protein [Actinomycetota bacterium]|jgi:branched-chain amino acid transport system substrate-binding protein|nr:branched-chain amino acid ABC transporter substrate-binding protein [Actinomycetota bacterium]
MTKWLRLLAILSVVALVAAACAEEGDGGAQPDGGDDPCAQDEFGCVEVASGAPIEIGTLLVITGSDASLGQDSQNGAVLATEFIGTDPWPGETAGEILGHPIEFNHQDDGCSAEGGQAGANALAAEENIVAVIGTSCSSAALGVADTILSDQGIPLISPSNTGPDLTAEATHQPFYLRTAHNDLLQGAAVAHFLLEEGAQTLATIHDGSPYADGLQQAAADEFSAGGGEVVAQEAVQVGDTDFGPLLTDIAADPPDALYYPIFVAEGGLITQQARETSGLEDTLLAGSDGMFTPDWIEAAGPENAEGVFISGPDLTAFANPEFYENEFLPAYEEQFGEEPQAVFHAHAFDAMMMLVAAIEEVAIETDDGGLQIPRTALKDALLATEGFEGIVGAHTCNELGDCTPEATMAVFTVEGGDFTEDPVFTEELNLEEIIGG